MTNMPLDHFSVPAFTSVIKGGRGLSSVLVSTAVPHPPHAKV